MFGIEFERAETDGLGAYSLAALDGGSAGQLWLVSYDHDPDPGTEVWVDISVARDEALEALWTEARWDIRAFLWVNPYPAYPGSPRLGEAMGIAQLRLTPREAEVGRLLSEGATISSIAASLRVSASAVRKHVALLRLKFGAASTDDLKERLARARVEPPASRLQHSA